MKIEKIPLSKIRENSYNPNTMPEAVFESLVASIRDHGYVQPIIVRRLRVIARSGSDAAISRDEIASSPASPPSRNDRRAPLPCYEIVDGAHRFRALKKLGRRRAECVVVEDGAEAAKLRTLTMNRLRGKANNFDMAKILEGFKPDDIERYLAFGRKERRELETLLERTPPLKLSELQVEPMPVVVEFLMAREEAAEVEQALRGADEESRSKALLAICRFYVDCEGKGQS